MSPIGKLQEMEHWDVHEGVEAALVAEGENMTGLMCWWPPGSSFPTHTHPHEQIGVVMAGQPLFTIDGVEHLLGPGDVYHVPSGAPHAQRNEGDETVIFFECFSPVREDLLRRKFEQKVLD
jgi:unsaturated pyranuronate lyase